MKRISTRRTAFLVILGIIAWPVRCVAEAQNGKLKQLSEKLMNTMLDGIEQGCKVFSESLERGATGVVFVEGDLIGGGIERDNYVEIVVRKNPGNDRAKVVTKAGVKVQERLDLGEFRQKLAVTEPKMRRLQLPNPDEMVLLDRLSVIVICREGRATAYLLTPDGSTKDQPAGILCSAIQGIARGVIRDAKDKPRP